MSEFALVPWAQTEWSAADRLFASTPLPLTPAGVAACETWGRELAGHGVQIVFADAGQTAHETAAAVAQPGRLKVKTMEGIEELSVGLWEGLTTEKLKNRFPKVHRLWLEEPDSVCPPEGEDLASGRARLREALFRIRKKAGDASFAVVLGPLSCALIHCLMDGVGLNCLHDMLISGPIWYDAAALGRLTGGADLA